ncbi:hypothetical protein N431DRAFT_498703 [Stipitochalara longipes BDJ]|nr:hypothetical protein N431DRAFT_498703 [Stipitochalara longipes BDJ]
MDLYAATSSTTEAAMQRRELRACANCAHAKAKCVPSEAPGGKCQRCDRLLKTCEPTLARVRPPTRKRRNPETARVSRSHVEKLEEKLDGLVTLIRSAHETGVTPGLPLATASTANLVQRSSGVSTNIPGQPIFPIPDQVPRWENNIQHDHKIQTSIPSSASQYTVEAGRSSSKTQGSLGHQFEIDDFDLGCEDPDMLLAVFRDEMSPNFPFIDMTEFTRAEDLRRERPTLYTVILAVTTRNTLQGRALGQAFLKQLAERMVVNGERNMDLLLACLIYAAWCRELLARGHYLTFLLGSFMTISSDLGLNRPTYRDTPGNFERLVRRFQNIPDFKDSAGTLEERRAFLGYFYLSSVLCCFGRRLDVVPWTPYLEESCRILDSPGMSRHDKSAVMLCRIQMVAQRLGQNPWEGKQDFTGNAPPPLLYLKSLQNQIQKLRDNQDSLLEDETIINWTYHNSEVLSQKIGLSESPAVLKFPDRDFNRLQYLCACLAAVKSFLEIVLGMPASTHHTTTVPMTLQIIWNTGTLHHLSTFQHPDWDVGLVSEAIDFFDFLKRLINTMGMVKEALGCDFHTSEGLDFWSVGAKSLANVEGVFKGRIADPDPSAQRSRESETSNFSNFPPGVEFMDFMDDVWMGPSDYQRW